MEAPSAPDLTLSQKLTLLWETNKPVFIAICVLITLIFFAIVFCIVYFAIIKPNQQHHDAEVDQKTAHLAYMGLRSFMHS